jgi:hypothetical protein
MDISAHYQPTSTVLQEVHPANISPTAPQVTLHADCKRLVTQRQEARQFGDSYVVVSPHHLMTHLHEKKSRAIPSIHYLTVQPTPASPTPASQTPAVQTRFSKAQGVDDWFVEEAVRVLQTFCL